MSSSFPPGEGSSEMPGALRLSSINLPQQPEKNACEGWLENLTPEERRHYDHIGYEFKLLKAIFENPEIITLGGEETGAHRFAFEEVMDMMQELTVHSRAFLGKELERDNADAATLTSFYCALHRLKTLDMPSRKADREFLESVIRKTKPFAFLSSGKKSKEEKEEIAERLRENLQMSQADEAHLLKALELIKSAYKKIRQAGDDPIMGQMTREELSGILDKLQQIDCLRRVFPDDNERFGISEVKYLMDFVKNWIRLFRELVPGKKDSITVITSNENHPDSPTAEKVLGDRREFLEHRAKALTAIFPDRVTPMIMMHHRDSVRAKIQDYRKIVETVGQIENKKLQSLIKLFLARISTIMSYLEFMWSMHELVNDQSGKRIIYPKKMLLLTPVIYQEMKKLEKGFRMFAEECRGQRVSDLKQSLQHEAGFSQGLGVTEDSQAEFMMSPEILSIDRIRQQTNEKTSDATQTSADFFEGLTDKNEEENRLADTFEMVAMMLQQKLQKADSYLERVQFEKVETRVSYGNPQISLHPETLTYHIQDFINEVQGALIAVLVEVTNAFRETRLPTRQIIPEYRDQEDQAAELRLGLHRLKTTSEEAKAKIMQARITDPESPNAEEALLKTKMALTAVATRIMRFQQTQDQAMAEKKYHSVLKGQHYEFLNDFAHTITEYFLEEGSGGMTPEVLAVYATVKDVEEFGNRLERESQMEPGTQPEDVKTWMEEYRELRKLRDNVHGSHMNGGLTGETRKLFVDGFIRCISGMKKIAESGKEPFVTFAKNHPLTSDITPENFSPEYIQFERLMTQFENFHTMLGVSHELIDQQLTNDHDERLAEEVQEKLDLIATEIRTTGEPFTFSDMMFHALTECQASMQHLQYRNPELAKEIHDLLEYLHSYPDFLSRHQGAANECDISQILSAIARIKQKLNGQKSGDERSADSGLDFGF